MSKTLVLKPRMETPQGIPVWHDAVALQRAIDYSSRRKPMSQLGVQVTVAGRLQVAMREGGGQVNAVLEIEVSEGEGKVLWDAIGDLPPEGYWAGPAPPLVTVGEFVEDVREQLIGEGP